MNNLQKLLSLRGLTIARISNEIGQGYHITQKVIKGTRYKRKDGSFGIYSSLPVENGIAGLLGLSHSQVWGSKSNPVLRRLIKAEIARQVRQREREMRKQYLNIDTLPKKQAVGNV